ncbi:MAG: hypothetical protein ACRD8Z_02775 [Nitrososphaeraceae archaeon]
MSARPADEEDSLTFNPLNPNEVEKVAGTIIKKNEVKSWKDRYYFELVDGDEELADDILFTLVGIDAYIRGRLNLNDLKRVSNLP